MEPKFIDFPLRLIEPSFNSSLVDTIIELERLRSPRRIKSRVNSRVFLQLKEIFHTLESLGSVRIEGNNTTLSDIVEKTIDGTIQKSQEENIKEFKNNQKALNFIEENIKEGTIITKSFISEFQRLTVADLDPSKEGDYVPGQYRNKEVKIKNSLHKPPLPIKVPELMDELLLFINNQRDQKYKLLSTAIVHHRFAWIHPFNNGNGRTVRLLTYAMLMSQGFSVNRLLNPTAVFCNDRNIYYQMLAEADKGTDQGLLKWSEYVLNNLLVEIRKIDKLLDYDYLIPEILLPTLDYSYERKNINTEEYLVLKLAVQRQEVKAGDINEVLKKKHHTQVSSVIKKLKQEGLLVEAPGKVRTYVICFNSNHLLRGIINFLRKGDFIGTFE
ncbi:MAG: Fic family protein [Patescibacteria group bacterium]|jgi:Fic family protein